MNWGWSGLANGYYLLSVLEPEEQGTGGNSGGGFSLDQNAIISMMKPVEGSTYQDVLVFSMVKMRVLYSMVCLLRLTISNRTSFSVFNTVM